MRFRIYMSKCVLSFCLLAFCSILTVFSFDEAEGGYKLKVLARTGDDSAPKNFTNIDEQFSLDDSGTVAFCATFSGGEGVFTQNSVIAIPGDNIGGGILQFDLYAPIPSLNNSGQVAFSGFSMASPGYSAGFKIFTQNGILVDCESPLYNYAYCSSPIINDFGLVAFRGGSVASPIYTQNGRLVSSIGSIGGKNYKDLYTYGRWLNNSGEVVFLAYLIEGGVGIFTQNRLVAATGDTIGGKTLTHIECCPSINSSGEIVFTGRFSNEYTAFAEGIFGENRLIVEPNYNVGIAGPPSINDLGEIAFNSGGQIFTQNGLVAGPGSPIEGEDRPLEYPTGPPVINNSGQIAFKAYFRSYGNPYLIILATPEGDGSTPPQINDISPTSGPVGTVVTITGSNFDTTQGTNGVTYGYASALVQAWSDTQIQVTVPSLTVGDYDVVVTTSNGSSNAIRFSVTRNCRSSDPLFFHNSIALTPIGPRMLATFMPNNGCTLEDVAQAFGFDHFNWISIVVQAPLDMQIICGSFVPFLDPLPGNRITCSSGWADNLDYYWNEINQDGTKTNTELDHWTTSSTTLIFRDTPSWETLGGNNVIKFYTSLVGVGSGNVWKPLDTFIWETTYNGTAGGVHTFYNTDDPDPGSGSGGINIVKDSVDLSDIPLAIRQFMVLHGAQGVPLPSLAVDFDAAGLWLYRNAGWSPLTSAISNHMASYGNKLVANFSGYGLYEHDGTTWTQLTANDSVEDIVGVSIGFYADYGSLGLWMYDGTWTQITGASPDKMTANGDKLVATFSGFGLYQYDGATWTQLSSNGNVENMLGISGKVYADYGSLGLWKYDGTWTQMSSENPDKMQAYNGKLIANFASYGLYLYDGTTWTQLTSNDSVEDLIGVSGNLYADYGTLGLWKYNGTWTQISGADASLLGSYGDKLVANFPAYGLYEYDGSSWTLLTGNSGVTDMVAVDLP